MLQNNNCDRGCSTKWVKSSPYIIMTTVARPEPRRITIEYLASSCFICHCINRRGQSLKSISRSLHAPVGINSLIWSAVGDWLHNETHLRWRRATRKELCHQFVTDSMVLYNSLFFFTLYFILLGATLCSSPPCWKTLSALSCPCINSLSFCSARRDRTHARATQIITTHYYVTRSRRNRFSARIYTPRWVCMFDAARTSTPTTMHPTGSHPVNGNQWAREMHSYWLCRMHGVRACTENCVVAQRVRPVVQKLAPNWVAPDLWWRGSSINIDFLFSYKNCISTEGF